MIRNHDDTHQSTRIGCLHERRSYSRVHTTPGSNVDTPIAGDTTRSRMASEVLSLGLTHTLQPRDLEDQRLPSTVRLPKRGLRLSLCGCRRLRPCARPTPRCADAEESFATVRHERMGAAWPVSHGARLVSRRRPSSCRLNMCSLQRAAQQHLRVSEYS